MGPIEEDLNEIWDIIDKELSDKAKKLFAKKMYKFFENIEQSFLLNGTDFWEFLMDNDDSFLRKNIKADKGSKKELFDFYSHYGRERVLKILNKLYD